MHPIDQGFMGYSQNVSKLAGFNDRVGEHASNGRDIGVQLQGDVFKTASGRALLHYQVGVFNGQGINTKDVDNQKDVIGGLWVMPVQGLRIGAFGWTGSYARKGSDGIKSLDKNRYAISGEYVFDDWTFRSEYIHSTGYGFASVYNQASDLKVDDVNVDAGNANYCSQDGVLFTKDMTELICCPGGKGGYYAGMGATRSDRKRNALRPCSLCVASSLATCCAWTLKMTELTMQ